MAVRIFEKIKNRNEVTKFSVMNNNAKLLLIKSVHSLIWLFFNVVIFYLLYAVIINKIDKWVWICVGLVVLEGLVLLAFKIFCPLTVIARKYSDSTKDNFDIFLPSCRANHCFLALCRKPLPSPNHKKFTKLF